MARRRRSPGSGIIRPLKGGRHKASYPKPGGGYWTRTCDTLAEAKAWLDTFADQKRKRLILTGGQQPLGQWLETWLATRPAHLKQTTRADYAYKLAYLQPLADVRLVDLTPDAIDDVLRELAQSLADVTVRQIRGLLVRALREARRRRYIPDNPAEAERTSRAPMAPPIRLSAGNVRSLLRHAKAPWLAAWWLIVCCGLRAGEVCGLRRSDLNLEAGTLQIVQQVVSVDGRPMVSTPKTAASVRELPIPAAAVAVLREHLSDLDRRARNGQRRGTWENHGLVFPGKSGRPMTSPSLRHALKAATDAAQLPPVTTHMLRHTCAGLLEHLQAPEYVIAGILGHGPRVITRHYAPPSLATKREWIEQVAGLITGGAALDRRAEKA